MSASTLTTGFRLGKYEVLSHVATGGMGSVYKALDTELRRTVALKVLPAQAAGTTTDIERFQREARLAARLSHKHIVTLFGYDYSREHDLHYLAMEFIEGIDLDQHIALKGRLYPEDARRILIQAARALEHAFERGVVHRDIKPANFLLAQVGPKIVVKLTDLGLALVQGDDDFKVTRAGSTVGTVDYMAPEQARDSRSSDIRSDIYSLGCTGFHMLAGCPPFFEGGLGERVLKHINEAPPDVRRFNSGVSAGFWAILQKMLAKNPDDRYANPTKLLKDLSRTPAAISAEAPVEPVLSSPQRNTDFTSSPTLSALPAAEKETPPPVTPTEQPAPRRSGSSSSSGTTAAASHSANGTPLVSLEDARAAAAFHERALQVQAEGGGQEYTCQLLENCLKLDPFNSAYHKTLREVNRRVAGGVLSRLFGSLNLLALKSKLRLARSSGDARKVLVQGEAILARYPADVDTHLDMAGAAADTGLHDLALWFLEEARDLAPDHVALLRALATQYERVKNWKRAIKMWERVSQLKPDDAAARKKINELSVEAHISRGNYRR